MSGMRLSGSKPGPSRRYPVSFALGGAQFSIPRPLVRGLILLVALGALYFIAGAGGKVDDTWSATSESERGRARESEGWSRFDGLSRLFGGGSGQRQPSSQAPIGRDKNGQIKLSPRPNTYRLDRPLPSSRTNPYHPGHSRVVIPNTNPVEYELRPLPSIEEAFAHLRPRLYDLKEKFPEIPREHDLNNPIHPPFLTPELMERYAHLGGEWDDKKKKWVEGGEKRYLFTTVCRQVTGMLADWFATWTVVVDFLGPESCVFALMEGPSDDGAGEIIAAAMKEHLLFLGVPPENLFIQTHMPAIDWENSHRIQTLADLRNAVMQPIYDSKYPGKSPDNKEWSAVLFYNDVYFGGRHFLEILHQHFFQDADMTCGWDHAGKWFYDGWVGRDMSGDLYTPFPVPKDQQEDPQRLFINHPATLERHTRVLPYQVFAGWNGMAVMNPVPFLPPYNVRFRRGVPRRPDQQPGEEECQASESSFISWDFWKYGFGRIAVVPGIHLTYGKDDSRVRGYVEYPLPDAQHSEKIEWVDEPPRKVRCQDWPDKPGKGHWAWDGTRWTDPPPLIILDPNGTEIASNRRG
ncbi:Alpha-1,3-mannosyltransferase CMT1 [Vanrija pseudolonga]|uniref:Alpha-1,3-mannosyltransferase CMT1 n=1 Tax=Vanrija pseudolonga TaxID=143232 RepID=A0AAF0Y8W5_9TREE|nr:Alpha-1,3-mannosyltransferase CMT1 [Vanrija pseudolonga]